MVDQSLDKNLNKFLETVIMVILQLKNLVLSMDAD